MKKIIFTLLLSAVSFAVWAVPAKPGQYKTITLADGSQVRVELCGDDHINYWKAADGRTFVKNYTTQQYELTEVSKITPQHEFIQTRQYPDLSTLTGMKKSIGQPHTQPLKGEMRGLVILCNFSDVKFAEGHDNALYQRIVNEKGYTDTSVGFVGSVRDYFLAQSDNQLDYEFDIIGPVDLPQTQHYYGQNGNSSDINMKQFVVDALNAAKSQIDFSKYDNDGDGFVDEVFFIYAGMGEADGGADDTIWPHMYYLNKGYGVKWSQNYKYVDVYACANEIQGGNIINGIGTMCHEFSHCLGLPDFYDTSGSGDSYAMAYWSTMNAGCYLDNAFRPCGYTAYEREFCGWRTIQTLTEEKTLEDLPGMEEGGIAYKMVCKDNSNEYFVLEPRTKVGWDTNAPASGLLVYHIDYQESAWTGNTINAVSSHPRCKIVDANGDYTKSPVGGANDVFGGSSYNDEFSDLTTPSTKLFSKNTTYDYKLHQSIYRVRVGEDGRPSFCYTPTIYEYKPETVENALFYESFDHCYGNGGNDGTWTTATGVYRPDNTWDYSVAKGAMECAMFGKSTGTGTATTPEFEIDGTCVLTFKACPLDVTKVSVTVDSGSATLGNTSFSATKKQWNEYQTTLTGTGKVSLMFSATKRFFLDEVLVMPSKYASIEDAVSLTSTTTHQPCYNLAGQQVGDNYRGVVIVNGKKVLR